MLPQNSGNDYCKKMFMVLRAIMKWTYCRWLIIGDIKQRDLYADIKKCLL